MEKKAIIIGATSGIGEALAERLSKEGYALSSSLLHRTQQIIQSF